MSLRCELCNKPLKKPYCEIYGHKVCHICYRTLVNLEYDAEALNMTVIDYINSMIEDPVYAKKLFRIFQK